MLKEVDTACGLCLYFLVRDGDTPPIVSRLVDQLAVQAALISIPTHTSLPAQA
jgi:hypothetical protein